MTRPRILVAGIGNIFLGDDAFGTEVARRLLRRQLPEEVRVVDFGIRGLDLTYALLDGYEAAVLIDAVPRGGRPGTLYVLEPDIAAAESANDGPMEAHGLDPVKVLRLAISMGAKVDRLLLVGCEPTPDNPDEMAMSDAVRAAVDEAVPLVESLVAKLLRGEAVGAR
jgi:hydrogenase maturation protease